MSAVWDEQFSGTVVPFMGIGYIEYRFHHESITGGGGHTPGSGVAEVGGVGEENIRSQGGGASWAPIAVFLLLLFLGVGAAAFAVWFSRRPITSTYTVSNVNLTRPEDWPNEITWTYQYLVPIGKIASGGLATVYLIQDKRYGGAYLALKLLHEQFCLDDEVDLKLRFLDEPAIMQHLAGTGYVPAIFDKSESNFSRPWFELEYLDEMLPMRRMVGGKAHNRIETAWLLPVMLNVTRAVRAIHHCGVVHRDLSPENIMLSFSGTANVKIIDFGGAKYRRKTFSRDDFFHNVTIPGQQIGKVHYTAPELWRDGIQTADFRSDGYSIAVSFWEMTTGQPPFAGDVAGQVRQFQAKGVGIAGSFVQTRRAIGCGRSLGCTTCPGPKHEAWAGCTGKEFDAICSLARRDHTRTGVTTRSARRMAIARWTKKNGQN